MNNANKSKRYYWIKLKDSFFTSDTVDFLMSQKNGANYIVLYQMLCLKAVNTNGLLARQIGEIMIPFDAEKIQRDCKYFDIDTIRVALELYKKLGLIAIEQNGVIQITNFDNMIGSETQGAIEKREQRALKQQQLLGIDKGIDNVYQEKDIRDKILDTRDKEEDYIYNIAKKDSELVLNAREVLLYLNEKTNKKYKNIESNLKFIKARLKDYTVDDLKSVIDKKVAEWKGTDMDKYLRCETLFNASKFECYINENSKSKPTSKKWGSADYYDSDDDEVF